MTIENAIRERINELARKNNITINKVSTLAGLKSYNTISIYEQRNTRSKNLYTIAYM